MSAAAPENDPVFGGRRRLLIADDEPIVRRALGFMVARSGLPVTVVAEVDTGRQAVEEARRHAPELLLLDVRMPEMDGITALGAIREFLPEVQAAVVSAYDEFDFAQAALEQGAVDYLLKPVREERLHAVIEDMLRALDRRDAERRQALELQRRWEAAEPLLGRELIGSALAGEMEPGSDALEWAGQLGLRDGPGFLVLLRDEAGSLRSGHASPPQALLRVRIALSARVTQLCTIAGPVAGGWALMVVAPEREQARLARTSALSAVQAEPAEALEVGALFHSLAEAGRSIPGVAESPEKGRRPTHRAVLRAQAIMRQRLAEEVTLSAVAAEVGLTATYLSHLFHAEVGHSFQRHRINLRIGHALFLLQKGDQTVAAVRQACGYEDAGYFARLVRGRTGLTPGEIRRRGEAGATAT